MFANLAALLVAASLPEDLFLPADAVQDGDILDPETSEALINKVIADEHFRTVSMTLYSAYLEREAFATRKEVRAWALANPDKAIKADVYVQVAEFGVSYAEASSHYERPKAAKTGTGLPGFVPYLWVTAFREVAPSFRAAFDRLLGAERAATVKACEGLPDAVVDWDTFVTQSGKYQLAHGLVLPGEDKDKAGVDPLAVQIKDKDGNIKLYHLSTGYRNDLFAPTRKVKTKDGTVSTEDTKDDAKDGAKDADEPDAEEADERAGK